MIRVILNISFSNNGASIREIDSTFAIKLDSSRKIKDSHT
jgi:hypothetical protein